MESKVIKTKKHYDAALQRFEEIFLAKSNTKEGKEAQLLAIAIKDYDDKFYPLKTAGQGKSTQS